MQEDIARLLRYESSAMGAGATTSIQDYVARMPATQDAVYFVVAPSRDVAEASPYMEAFKDKGIEVLYMYEALDDIVMTHLNTFAGKKVVSVSSSEVKLGDEDAVVDGQKLALAAWVKDQLGATAREVKVRCQGAARRGAARHAGRPVGGNCNSMRVTLPLASHHRCRRGWRGRRRWSSGTSRQRCAR
jgi:HSP90 family molecular chaperone